jgi:hypothetical protein
MQTQLTNLSAAVLRRAADIQDRIESLQRELSALLETKEAQPAAPSAGGVGRRGGRKMSAAGKARIAAAARKRWAQFRAGQPKAPAKKPTRRMSPAARARLSALAKARWNKAKAAGKTKL